MGRKRTMDVDHRASINFLTTISNKEALYRACDKVKNDSGDRGISMNKFFRDLADFLTSNPRIIKEMYPEELKDIPEEEIFK